MSVIISWPRGSCLCWATRMRRHWVLWESLHWTEENLKKQQRSFIRCRVKLDIPQQLFILTVSARLLLLRNVLSPYLTLSLTRWLRPKRGKESESPSLPSTVFNSLAHSASSSCKAYALDLLASELLPATGVQATIPSPLDNCPAPNDSPRFPSSKLCP